MSSIQGQFSRPWPATAVLVLLVACTLVVAAPPQRRPRQAVTQERDPGLVAQDESAERMSGKQQRKLLKHNFEKMKEDSDELVDLARSLQEEIEKSSENVLSLQVVEKAEKIEKLAKRIKNTAKGS